MCKTTHSNILAVKNAHTYIKYKSTSTNTDRQQTHMCTMMSRNILSLLDINKPSPVLIHNNDTQEYLTTYEEWPHLNRI